MTLEAFAKSIKATFGDNCHLEQFSDPLFNPSFGVLWVNDAGIRIPENCCICDWRDMDIEKDTILFPEPFAGPLYKAELIGVAYCPYACPWHYLCAICLSAPHYGGRPEKSNKVMTTGSIMIDPAVPTKDVEDFIKKCGIKLYSVLSTEIEYEDIDAIKRDYQAGGDKRS